MFIDACDIEKILGSLRSEIIALLKELLSMKTDLVYKHFVPTGLRTSSLYAAWQFFHSRVRPRARTL